MFPLRELLAVMSAMRRAAYNYYIMEQVLGGHCALGPCVVVCRALGLGLVALLVLW